MAKETPKSKKPAAKKPAAKAAKPKVAAKPKATTKAKAATKSGTKVTAKSKAGTATKATGKPAAKAGAKATAKPAKKTAAKKTTGSVSKKKPEIKSVLSGTKRPVTLMDAPVVEQKTVKSAISSSSSIRMFKNPVLEKLSHVHPAVPFILYVPVVLLSIIGYFSSEESNLGTFLTLFPLGIFFWSIAEYTLHRFLFHPPYSETHLHWLYFYTHGVHHEAPNDASRLVMPPGASIPLAIIFYIIFQSIMPVHYLPFYAGFVTGYMIYDFLHFATHFYSFKSNWFKKLKKHHIAHHFNDPKKNYGVSNSLWDHVFATKFRGNN